MLVISYLGRNLFKSKNCGCNYCLINSLIQDGRLQTYVSDRFGSAVYSQSYSDSLIEQTSHLYDRFIIKFSLRNRQLPPVQLGNELQCVRAVNVNEQD